MYYWVIKFFNKKTENTCWLLILIRDQKLLRESVNKDLVAKIVNSITNYWFLQSQVCTLWHFDLGSNELYINKLFSVLGTSLINK